MLEKIDLIIFSKNRAAQLRLLLESLKKNCPIFNINILYTYSSDEFGAGYEKLQEEIRSGLVAEDLNLSWILQENFKEDVIRLVENSYDLVCFSPDDLIWHKNIEKLTEFRWDGKLTMDAPYLIGEIFQVHKNHIACFSLRLGLDLVVQNYATGELLPKLIYNDNEIWIAWNRLRYPSTSNYNYPLALDGHVFLKEMILGLIKELDNFENPTTLEAGLTRFIGDSRVPPYMAALKESVVVSTPVNRVQQLFNNTAGLFHSYSLEELNNRYLGGEVIDLDRLDFSNVNSSHYEIEFKFKNI